MIPDNVRSALRRSVERYAHPRLSAATATFDETINHLRIDFFFAGTSEDIDFEELESGVIGEMIGQVWQNIETFGFAAVFDGPAGKVAASLPSRLYPI